MNEYKPWVVMWPSAPYDNPNVHSFKDKATAKKYAETISRDHPGCTVMLLKQEASVVCPVAEPSWWPDDMPG